MTNEESNPNDQQNAEEKEDSNQSTNNEQQVQDRPSEAAQESSGTNSDSEVSEPAKELSPEEECVLALKTLFTELKIGYKVANSSCLKVLAEMRDEYLKQNAKQ